jgi:hypothetical protein
MTGYINGVLAGASVTSLDRYREFCPGEALAEFDEAARPEPMLNRSLRERAGAEGRLAEEAAAKAKLRAETAERALQMQQRTQPQTPAIDWELMNGWFGRSFENFFMAHYSRLLKKPPTPSVE